MHGRQALARRSTHGSLSARSRRSSTRKAPIAPASEAITIVPKARDHRDPSADARGNRIALAGEHHRQRPQDRVAEASEDAAGCVALEEVGELGHGDGGDRAQRSDVAEPRADELAGGSRAAIGGGDDAGCGQRAAEAQQAQERDDT